MTTKEIIDRIFKEPRIKYELTEFENLGKPIHEILTIYPKAATTGKDAGKTKYYLKSFIPFSTGNEEVQVYAEGVLRRVHIVAQRVGSSPELRFKTNGSRGSHESGFLLNGVF